MKRKITVFLLLWSVVLQGMSAAMIDIRGRVLQTENREAIELANVVLQTPDSVFVAGTATNETGDFVFSKVESDDYRLIILSIGYQTQHIDIQGTSENLQLGEILMSDDRVMLDGVTVTASATTGYSDRKVIFPSEIQLKASTNGVDLLQQLMLPRLVINPLLGEVSLPGGGEVQYRINGVKVELQEIKALKPSDIVRVEFHDNPGLRYGDAEIVLDYIVRRPETGGSIGVGLSESVNAGFGNNSVNAKINHKKSEFSANYWINHRSFVNLWRDNEEKFTFSDGSVLQRKEVGEPGRLKLCGHYMNGTYSFQDDKSMFSATFRYFTLNHPNMDYKGTLYNMADVSDAVYMVDRTATKTHRPALDLYYQRNLKNDQTLVINVVGTYNKEDVVRVYHESRNDEMLTDVNNRVTGKKYSLIGEGIYEKRIGKNRIGGGLKHTQTFSDNTYRNGSNYTTEMNQAQTYLYGEFKGKVEKLDYTLGVGVTRSYFSQEGAENDEDYTFNPRVVLHYTLPGNSSIRLRGDIRNSSPSLSNMNAVEQIIDSLQIQRGNPNLKPYLRYSTELTYELRKGMFYGNLWGTYEYQPDVIMDEKYLDGDKIVQTWDNQENWQRLSGRMMLRVGPIKNIVSLSLTGGVNHYISNGNTYKHEYTNWYGQIDLNAMYKKVTANFGLNTDYNRFYGETLNGGENIHYLMLGYRHKALSLGAGVLNPFVDNFKQKTANRSQYASYEKSNYIKESSRLLLISMTYNFSFGRTFKSGQKQLNNADEESGVMSTGK